VFTAKPNVGYVVDYWINNGIEIAIQSDNAFITYVTSDLNVKVKFRPADGVVLTYGAYGGNGSLVGKWGGTSSITSGTPFASGDMLTEGYSLSYYATPDVGYEVAYWIINGEIVYLTGRLYTVKYLQGVGETAPFDFDVRVAFQPIDPTGGRSNGYNGTNKSRLGLNITYPGGLNGGVNAKFTEDYLESLAPFGSLRMPSYSVNDPSPKWADRVQPNGNQSSNRGPAWEYSIAIANATKSDIWICVPVYADEEYIRNLATLFKNSLDPHLKLYVEWDNEVWGFANQKNMNKAMALEKNIPTDSRSIWNTYGLWWEWTEYFHFAQRRLT